LLKGNPISQIGPVSAMLSKNLPNAPTQIANLELGDRTAPPSQSEVGPE
jgi:hypothetical protein